MRGIISIAAAVAMLGLTGIASAAEITVSGTATGRTIPIGDSAYRMIGTWRDASGAVGTYNATVHTVAAADIGGQQYPAGGTPDDFTSCPFVFFGTIGCIPPPVLAAEGDPYPNRNFRCNLLEGSITVRSRGKELTLAIGSGNVFRPRVHAAVCTSLADPAIHETDLEMSRIVDSFPVGTDEFNRGYGPLAIAEGSLRGISTPLGGGGVYSDTMELNLRLS
jgi:hypothetical protein